MPTIQDVLDTLRLEHTVDRFLGHSDEFKEQGRKLLDAFMAGVAKDQSITVEEVNALPHDTELGVEGQKVYTAMKQFFKQSLPDGMLDMPDDQPDE